MMIHKITHSVDYNWLLKNVDTQLNGSTNKNSIKLPTVVKPKNKKTLFVDLSVIKKPLSFSSLVIFFQLFSLITEKKYLFLLVL